MGKNLYIVPHDLTEVGNFALEYAFYLCKRIEAEIRILHLVTNKSQINAVDAKIDQIIAGYDIPAGATITKQIQEGNIFEDIGRIATKNGAQLIIMGTHGQRGMQKLFRSHAIKVITSCEIPFLIVQRGTKAKDLEKIVVPIDLTKESLQAINIAGDIATIYKATVHVIGAKQNDELLNQQMKNRILIIKNQYEERNVNCNVQFLKDGGSYSKKVMNYCKENDIDLIAFAYHSESLFPQLDTFAQNLITNELLLPCLVLNSKQASALYF
ncbi:MAG TPA: universal stress protein [Taishania sp.]|nr:universal stress protein [Taishania sp.]